MKSQKSNHIVISSAADCCGCTACYSVCSQHAIEMRPDAFGFIYPYVDEDKCIECGACNRVCAFHKGYDISENLSEPIVYGAIHKDEDEIMKSRSGAAFVAISDYILEHGGVVYGAGYKDHFRVVHKRATNKEERDEFRGSKYVQSDLTGVFHSVKNDLKNRLPVLFSGTPCQTAGLNAYVGKKLREKLVLVDIVCHGVPGPYLWRDYLVYLEKKNGARIVSVNFRDKKKFGWKDHKETFVFDKGKEREEGSSPICFYNELFIRKSCTQCPFANTKRPSDITIGDFWGIEKIHPEMDKEDRGVNLVMINTDKGMSVYQEAGQAMHSFRVMTDDYLQPNLIAPTEEHPQRDEFENYYTRHGFKKSMVRYGLMDEEELGGMHNLIKRIKRAIKRRIQSAG